MAGKTPRKKIAVIGAGRSGLAAIKSCKEEGMDVVCFEKTDSFGGVWKYREDNNEGVGSVMKSTVALFSKEMDAFSDFPPPDDFPNYLHHTMMMEYLDMYVEKHNLLDYIRYYHEVIDVRPVPNQNHSVQWLVKSKYTEFPNSTPTEEALDGVIVCTGKRGYPFQPYLPSQEKFNGKILHSKLLRTATTFEKQNVLIVGFGNSAVDAATEISAVAKQVYLSTRSGGWIVPKVGTRGIPSDILFLRRRHHWLQKLSPKKVNDYLEKLIFERFGHTVQNVKPDHDILSRHPTINDDFPDKVLTGRIIIKGDIKEIQSDGVIFENEDEVTNVDVIILATGFKVNIPFLEDKFWRNEEGGINLYKFVFPVTTSPSTLAFIGLLQPLGPSLPIAEAQCRWACRVMSSKITLPTVENMIKDMNLTLQIATSLGGLPIVDYIEYMNELTSQYNAKPDIFRHFWKDPVLYWSCFSGPCLPYQYRLLGSHPWHEARQAIMTYSDRVKLPFIKRADESRKHLKVKTYLRTNYIIAAVVTFATCFIITI